MGTRGFITFATDGEIERTVYNHFDSYPTGLGHDMMAFVRDMEVNGTKESCRQMVRDLVAVNESDSPTPEQAAKLDAYHQDVSTGSDWYAYLRGTQGEPVLILESGFYCNASMFPLESLWAEWGYVCRL